MLRSDPIVAPISSIQPLAGAPLPEENGSGTGTAAVGDGYNSLPSAYSGTGNPTKIIPLNGNQAIDGLLTTVGWNGATIDYSFPTTNGVYGYTELTDLPAGFFQLTAAQRNAVYFALDADMGVNAVASAGFSLEGITNLGVSEDTTPDTDQIRLANTTSPSLGTARVADFPANYITSQIEDNGDVWFGTNYSYTNPIAGSYEWHTHIHELGHAVGLKHGHENSLDGPMPANVDSMEYSVMTYRSYIGAGLNGYTNESFGYAQTWMMYDIAALQHMYGADFTTNGGNTTYTWNPVTGDTLVNGVLAIDPGGNRVFQTIWDGNGTDTYNLSNYSTNLNINLAPGGHSVFSGAQLAYLGGGPNGGYARGNVFNALQYQGDARSLIENANGGSGNDTINGNNAANTLNGLIGDDFLFGTAGNDSLSGGDGVDTVDGGTGTDQVRGGLGNDTVMGGFQADILFGGQGADIFQCNNLQASLPGTRDQIRATTGTNPAIAFEGAGVAGVGDLINVVGIDADTTAGGNQAFIFGGGTGKGHLWCTNSGNDTFVNGNVNNNLNVDFRIEIEDAGVSASMYKDFDFML